MKELPGNQQLTDTFFAGDSEMHRHIREFNWQDSVLGPVSSWPQSLKTAVHVILNSHYPMAIWWGPEMIMFNNDAFMAFMGRRQPASLGQPAQLLWADIWEVVGPMFNKILDTGEAWFADKLLLYNERKGFKEEAYFTFSCSPIIRQDGEVGGIFCTSSEDTGQVLSERRLETLLQIGTISVETGCIIKASTCLIDILGLNEKDIPFALLYSYADGQYNLTNYTEAAFATDLHTQPGIANAGAWPLQEPDVSEPLLLDDITALTPYFKVPSHHILPQKAFALPIVIAGTNQVTGLLVTGISPVLELDDNYKDFLELLNGHLNSLFTNITALEQEKLRNAKLVELHEAKSALLRESESLRAELEDVLENMSDAFIVLDQNLCYTYTNSNAGKITRRTKGDFIGKNIWDVFPDLVGTVFYDKVLETMANPEVVNFELYYDTLGIWYDIRMYPYKKGLSMYICDITGKKLEEQARQETEMRFKVMADAAPVLIWVSQHGSEPVYFNKTWLQFRGRTLEQEQNRGWLEGVHPDDLDRLYGVFGPADEHKIPFDIEMRMMGADGEYHWFINHGVPRIMPDGTFKGFVGACVDITKRKWAEELLSKYSRDLEERVEKRTAALQKTNKLLQEKIAEKKRTEESLSRSHKQLQALTRHLQVMREDERKYIARELHDELGQAFTALKIDVTLLLKKLSSGEFEQQTMSEELQSMMRTINGSITSVREIVATLRPAVLDNFGLLSEIESQAQDFQKRTAITMHVISDLEYVALDQDKSIEVFRIVQESMTNIARHADATEATITVDKTDKHFSFIVADNGKGMQDDNLSEFRTFGLLGMQERAERIGATLAFDTKPQMGTRVTLEVPFN